MAQKYEFHYDNNIPPGARKAIEKLSTEGKLVIASVFNPESHFAKHMDINSFISDFSAAPSQYPDLYHHTSEEGFKGIITSHREMITSQYYMNDPRENVYVTELALDYLRKDTRLSESDLNTFDISFHQTILDIYVWSFTNNEHSKTLATPEYGNFVLHFKNEKLQKDMEFQLNKKHVDMYNLPYLGDRVFPLKVEYDLDKQQEYVESVMETWKNAYLSYKNDKDAGMSSTMLNVMSKCYIALALCSLCFKDDNWKNEKEIRYVVIRNKKSSENMACHPDDFRNGKPKIFYDFNPQILKEVICKDPECDISQVRNLLAENGYEKTRVRIDTKLC